MRNKVLALILALVMIAGIAVMAPVASLAADGVEAIGPDTATEASTVLMTLNILQGYEDGSLQLDTNITRAEFAAMVARMLRGTDELNLNAGAIVHDKMSETPENIAAVKAAAEKKTSDEATESETVEGTPGESQTNVGAKTYYTNIDSSKITATPFSDVTSSHWSYDDVEFLRSMGVITGNSDGTFKPDDNITYEQVVKLVVAALGYDFMAESYGGYPDGYLSTASRLKLLKNAGGSTGAPATRAQVVVILFNALTTDYLVVDGISEGNNMLETGKSILNYVYDMEIIKGQVLATKNSGISLAADATEDGRIEIGSGNDFRYFDSYVEDYLGYYVKAYVKYDENSDNEGEVYAVFPQANSKKLVVKAEDIKSADVEGADKVVEIYSDDEVKEIKINNNPTVIYNDMAFADTLDDDDFDFDCGTVTFVANGGGNVYDLILIDNLVPMYVDTVKSSTKTLKGTIYANGTTTNDYELALDEDSDKYDITVDIIGADGQKTDFSAISADSVVEVKMWANHYKVYLGGQVVTGKLDKKGAGYVVMGETSYEDIEGSDILSGFSSGDNVKFGVTRDGYVFYAKMQGSTSSLNYGYLMKIATDDSKFGDDVVKVKIMDTTGKKNVYELAENMKLTASDGDEYRLNGSKSNAINATQLLTEIEEAASIAGLNASSSLKGYASSRLYEQVVKYAVNGDGQVSEIVLARRASSVPADEDKLAYFTVEDNDVSGSPHHANGGVLYGTPYVVSGAQTFWVAETNTPDDSYYRAGKFGTGAHSASHGYILYDVNDDGVPGIFVTGQDTPGTGTSYNFNNAFVVIEYMEESTIERDGEYLDGYTIGIINNGNYETKYSLREAVDGKDNFSDAGNVNSDGTYNTGDLISPRYWGTSGYLKNAYADASYKNGGSKASSYGADDSITFTGYYGVKDLIERIKKDDPSTSYFHYFFGTENWGNWEEEFTFGKITSVGASRMSVAYGAGGADATSVDINNKKVVKYDCETGYVSVVSASEIAEGDWAFVQQNNKATKTIMFFTNVESASVDNIQSDTNKRK